MKIPTTQDVPKNPPVVMVKLAKFWHVLPLKNVEKRAKKNTFRPQLGDWVAVCLLYWDLGV